MSDDAAQKVTDFPRIAVRKGGDVAVQEFFVFGERNSGTNFIDALLRRNFPSLANSASDRRGPAGFRYGWKHGFPQMVTAPDFTLAVVVFRRPEDWLRSMHERPWHAAPELRGLSFGAFIRAPWSSIVDDPNFGPARRDARFRSELQWDRHPLTGAPFENILALRNAKNAGFQSLNARFSTTVSVRYEDVAAAPEAFLDFLSRRFGLERAADYEPVLTTRGLRRGSAFKPSPPTELEAEDTRFVWSELDAGLEAALGYGPGA